MQSKYSHYCNRRNVYTRPPSILIMIKRCLMFYKKEILFDDASAIYFLSILWTVYQLNLESGNIFFKYLQLQLYAHVSVTYILSNVQSYSWMVWGQTRNVGYKTVIIFFIFQLKSSTLTFMQQHSMQFSLDTQRMSDEKG